MSAVCRFDYPLLKESRNTCSGGFTSGHVERENTVLAADDLGGVTSFQKKYCQFRSRVEVIGGQSELLLRFRKISRANLLRRIINDPAASDIRSHPAMPAEGFVSEKVVAQLPGGRVGNGFGRAEERGAQADMVLPQENQAQ